MMSNPPTDDEVFIVTFMQFVIDKDEDDSEDFRLDKCRLCEKEWWFHPNGSQVHKVWCPYIKAYERIYGKVPDTFQIV